MCFLRLWTVPCRLYLASLCLRGQTSILSSGTFIRIKNCGKRRTCCFFASRFQKWRKIGNHALTPVMLHEANANFRKSFQKVRKFSTNKKPLLTERHFLIFFLQVFFSSTGCTDRDWNCKWSCVFTSSFVSRWAWTRGRFLFNFPVRPRSYGPGRMDETKDVTSR